MKTAILITLILGSPLSLAAAQTPGHPAVAPEASNPNEIVLKVGELEFTRADHASEVNRLIPLNYFHSTVPKDRRQELDQQAQESLIERSLILLGARNRGLTPTEEQIRTKFSETLKQVGPRFDGISEKDYAALLAEHRPRVIRKLRIEMNEARFEASLPAITEEGLRARYAEAGDQLLSTERAWFLHILLKVDPSASSLEAKATMQKLEEIREKILAGTEFAEMARKHSEDIYAPTGGSIGFVSREEFTVSGLADQIFALADAELSPVMQSIYGYHLVHRIETRPRKPLTFDEARDKLVEILKIEQRANLRTVWLNALAESFPVEILVSFKVPEKEAVPVPASTPPAEVPAK